MLTNQEEFEMKPSGIRESGDVEGRVVARVPENGFARLSWVGVESKVVEFYVRDLFPGAVKRTTARQDK
jgi:hypothetical protein